MTKNSHCSYCGTPFVKLDWPRQCANCGNFSFINPAPVAVVVLPIDDGVLVVRRNIPPGIGELALPGGYINYGETWQVAGAREIWEEIGLQISPEELRDFGVLSSHDASHILVFGVAAPRTERDLPPFTPNEETQECVILRAPQKLVFPTHTQVMQAYFDSHQS